MTPSTAFAVARFILVGLLIWALFSHSHNYFVFLRWSVFLVSAYTVWRLIQEKEELFFVFAFLVFAVLFNPFMPFNFQRATWNVLDVFVALMFFGSIMFIDSGPMDKFGGSVTGKVVGNCISMLFSTGFILLGSWILWITGVALVDAFKLAGDRKEAVATIVDVTERTESAEIAPGHERSFEVYVVKYEFRTVDGRTFNGQAEFSKEPEEDTINIQYEKSNPGNNRTIEGRNDSLKEIIIQSVVLALVGGLIIYSAIDSIRKRIGELRQIKNPPVEEGV